MLKFVVNKQPVCVGDNFAFPLTKKHLFPVGLGFGFELGLLFL